MQLRSFSAVGILWNDELAEHPVVADEASPDELVVLGFLKDQVA